MSIEDKAMWCGKVIDEAMDRTPAELAIVSTALHELIDKCYARDFVVEDNKIKPEGTELYKEQYDRIGTIMDKMTELGLKSG